MTVIEFCEVGKTAKDNSDSEKSDSFSPGMSSRRTEERGNILSSKKIVEEETYDSGILSDAIILSEQSISDISGEIEDRGPKQQPPRPPGHLSEKVSDNKNSQQLMTLDSGIDIEVCDRLSGLNISSAVSLSDKTFSSNNIYSSLSESKSESEIRKQGVGNEENPWNSIYFQQDDDGNTQLHIAVLEGLEDIVNALLISIPDSRYIDIKNDFCQTSLHLAVVLNLPNIVRQLVLSGARTGICDRNGDTALHLACMSNYLDCVKVLLDPIADNSHSNITLKYTPEIDFPHRHVNEHNYEGLSCVHLAADIKNLHILHQLLIFGADVNIRELKAGYTILHSGTESGDARLVHYILQHPKIDLERKTYARLTAYQLSEDQPHIARMLLEKGAVCLPFPEDDDYDETDEDSDEEDLVQNFTHAVNSNVNKPPVTIAVTS